MNQTGNIFKREFAHIIRLAKIIYSIGLFASPLTIELDTAT
ncbi:hypothetical protein EVA_21641 [gut metagenome]|uniref:Uncharacterized protein n=1 Tax=gut metagenome TaxID=749906 RepID=J9F708_9ZZZZ